MHLFLVLPVMIFLVAQSNHNIDFSSRKKKFDYTIFIFMLSHNYNFFLQIAYICQANPKPL